MSTAAEHTSELYRRKALPRTITRRILRGQQQRMFARFTHHFAPRADLRVLDLGTDASLERPEQYLFQNLYPHRRHSVSSGLEDGARFHACFPELDYVRLRRGEPLPFEDGAFDVVHCAAVIEHVGSRDAQREFLREICRVGRSAFVTTPNRWYPIELHTVLPLVHYLPPQAHRPLLRRLGFDFFSHEENLNLLDHGSLSDLVPAGRAFEIERHRFLGFCSNLLLVIR